MACDMCCMLATAEPLEFRSVTISDDRSQPKSVDFFVSIEPRVPTEATTQTGFTAQPWIHAERRLIASRLTVGDDIEPVDFFVSIEITYSLSHE